MTNNTHQELHDAALTLKEMARFFAAGMCLDDTAIQKNPAIQAAQKLADYHQRQLAESSHDKKAAMPAPAMVSVQPSLPKQVLSVGREGVGRVKYPMIEKGYTHLQVVQVADESGFSPVAVEAVEDVFLHSNSLSAEIDKEDVAEGVLVKFTAVPGKNEGQIAAAEVSLWQESCNGENQKKEMT